MNQFQVATYLQLQLHIYYLGDIKVRQIQYYVRLALSLFLFSCADNSNLSAWDKSISNPSSSAIPIATPSPTAFFSKVAIYRFFNPQNGDFLFSLSPSEGTSVGYIYEGSPFSLLATYSINTIAVYRCYNGSRHYVSTDALCESQHVNEGTLGYLFTSPFLGSVPLFRLYQPGTGAHLESLYSTEGVANSFSFEFTQGYLIP